MKVAFISDHLLGGGKERRLIAIIQGLIKRGKIDPIIILWDGKTAEDSIAYKYVLDLGIPIYYMGYHTRYMAAWEIYKVLKTEKVKSVNFWAPPLYSYLMLIPQMLLRIPVYNSSITSGRDSFTWLQKFAGKHLYHFSRLVNSNSKRALEVFGIPPMKRKVIYNGFDFSRLEHLLPQKEIRKHFGIETKYIVSMAGRYSQFKDWPTHIKAANLILSKGYDVSFICMGGGDATPFEAMIEPGNENRILFVGRQNIVESVYNASDIVTLATPGEGISNSILEGMALSKPIVANEGGGTPEIVENGVSGFITKYKDVEEYANAIMKLLDDEELRISMGMRGRQIVEEKFNIEQMVDNFEKMIMYGK